MGDEKSGMYTVLQIARLLSFLDGAPLAALTRTEGRAFFLLVDGCPTLMLPRKLELSTRVTQRTVRALLAKLGVPRSGLVEFARDNGLK